MSDQNCMIHGCAHRAYAPAGTGKLCKAHFSDFVKWRRKKGGMGLFRKYNGMTSEERNATVTEWGKSL